MAQRPALTLILDLGNVLFDWTLDVAGPVTKKLLYAFSTSETWSRYNRGLITEDVCYQELSAQFAIVVPDIAHAISQIRERIVPNREVVAFLQELKDASKTTDGTSTVALYAMSNISAPDWKTVKSKLPEWSLFDGIFVSCETRLIKPDLDFYNHVISKTSTDPKTTVFIDDRRENVLPAQSLGLHGIEFKDLKDMKRQLKEICHISGIPAVI